MGLSLLPWPGALAITLLASPPPRPRWPVQAGRYRYFVRCGAFLFLDDVQHQQVIVGEVRLGQRGEDDRQFPAGGGIRDPGDRGPHVLRRSGQPSMKRRRQAAPCESAHGGATVRVSTGAVRWSSRASSSRQSALSSSGARAAPATRSRVATGHSARPANQHAIEGRWAAWSRQGDAVWCGMRRSDGPSRCPGHGLACQAGAQCPCGTGPAHPCDRAAAHTAAAPPPWGARTPLAAVRPGANRPPPDSAFAAPSRARGFGFRWHGVLGGLGQSLERTAGPPRPALAPFSCFGQNSLMKQSET